jgi:hypothetical protein
MIVNCLDDAFIFESDLSAFWILLSSPFLLRGEISNKPLDDGL